MKLEVKKTQHQEQTPQKKKLNIPPKPTSSTPLNSSSKKNTYNKITSIYHYEFEEEFPTILIIPQDEFLNKIFYYAMQKIKEIFPTSDLNQSYKREMLLKEEKMLRTIYLSKYKLLSAALNDYEANKSMLLKYSKHLSSKNNERFSFLKRFRKHCSSTDSIARHNCSRTSSKFLEVSEENPITKEETLTHVICIECKKCYPVASMLLYCAQCDCDYYSSLLGPNDKEDILPATWKKYHCGTMINEMMKCIKCTEVLYLNCKSLMLMCLNKKCNFVSEQHSIIWKCAICKKDFNSDAKVYNPLEFTVMKKAIRNALIIKMKVYPNKLPCCKDDMSQLSFFHKKECNGMIYQGHYNKTTIIICEKCNAINFYDKFIWTCPLCGKRFKSEFNPFSDGNINSGKSNIRITKSACEKRIEQGFISKDTEMCKPSQSTVNINNCTGESGLKKIRYNNLVDILDARNPGIKQNMLKRHRGCKSNDFGPSFAHLSSDNNNANTTLVTQESFCVNLLDNFNKLHHEGDGEYNQSGLDWLRDDKDDTVNQEKHDINNKGDSLWNKAPNLKNLVYDVGTNDHSLQNTNQPINLKANIKMKEKPKEKEIPKENYNYNDNESDIQPLIRCTKNRTESIIKKESENEKAISLINSQSKIPLFDMETFSIIKAIGEGSFGKIYLVECPETKTRYALKKIIAHNINEAKTIQKECELMHSVQHDHIMKIFNIQYKHLDFSTYSIYVLMELAQSDWNFDIKTRAIRSRYYRESELISIIKQIAQSLAFLQRKSISHRDIKPQNVLLYKQSIVKMADFGEAKEIKKNKMECTLRGTELYMSPILFEGLKKNKEDVVHNPYKSDVFSLGYCVLYASTLDANLINDIREGDNMKKHKEIVEKYLNNRYTKKFKELLIQMLEYNEKDRIDFIQLEEILSNNFS